MRGFFFSKDCGTRSEVAEQEPTVLHKVSRVLQHRLVLLKLENRIQLKPG